MSVAAAKPWAESVGMESAVPDVLASDLCVIFCGINPGRVSAAAAAHFANPRNDFWRLLHDAGFTPRLLRPDEQFEVPQYGIGLTNAALRTTKGSGDLRAADFDGSAERLERIARDLRPRAIAFVGKEAYRGAFRERPELGPQPQTLVDSGLFVLPSTSPANAAVPYAVRLHWFSALKEWLDLEPVEREAVRALVVDEENSVLLLRWARTVRSTFWITPGGGIERGETPEQALLRELREETGLRSTELGPRLWTTEFVMPTRAGWCRQRETVYLVQAARADVTVPDLVHENIQEHRWWSVGELEASDVLFGPARLPELVRDLLENGPPREPALVQI
jgi:TDG/mug DNA glycosylase family protein